MKTAEPLDNIGSTVRQKGPQAEDFFYACCSSTASLGMVSVKAQIVQANSYAMQDCLDSCKPCSALQSIVYPSSSLVPHMPAESLRDSEIAATFVLDFVSEACCQGRFVVILTEPFMTIWELPSPARAVRSSSALDDMAPVPEKCKVPKRCPPCTHLRPSDTLP